MFDAPFDRTLTFRLSAAADCWGRRRMLRRGIRNGVWFIDGAGLDEPQPDDPADTAHADDDRRGALQRLIASGAFTHVETATLHALVIERLTIAEIAARDRCSRQAVMARLVGNSRGQGGILRKARTLMATFEARTQ